jgi:hypothetical protein
MPSCPLGGTIMSGIATVRNYESIHVLHNNASLVVFLQLSMQDTKRMSRVDLVSQFNTEGRTWPNGQHS